MRRKILVVIVLACLTLLGVSQGLAQTPVVQAVLFYSPSCPHCQQVMQEDLPPLLEKYGSQLNILAVNVGHESGQALYRATIDRYQIPEDRLGVPCLVLGDSIMVGSMEIPEKFPDMIEAGLEAGGIAWPDIPGLSQVLAAQGIETPVEAVPSSPVASETEPAIGEQYPQLTIPPGSQAGPLGRFNQDKIGNSLAVIVLIGLTASAILTSYQVIQLKLFSTTSWPEWIFPVFILIGLIVALYLSYIEAMQIQAICGPVGDCNSVQQSPYARLFGVLPIGVLGTAGYLLIAAAWLIHRYGKDRWQQIGTLAIWGLALFGTLFSIYLTFLEPFVIGATCAWCLTSAMIMALLLWAATNPAVDTWKEI